MFMNWKDINVFKWQQLNELFINSKELNELDLATKASAICHGLTEHEIDSLPLEELKPILDSISFIHEEIKPEPQKYIKVNGKKYKCVYDVRKIPAARYIETKHFGEDVNGNLHKIAACLVLPMKRTLFGWKVDKYDASKHEDYSQDMLEAPVTAILGSVVFFYLVYKNWIKSSKDYLVKEMTKKGITRYQAEAVYQSLCDIMDGSTKWNSLHHTRKSRLKLLMSYLPYNSLTTSRTLKQSQSLKQSK